MPEMPAPIMATSTSAKAVSAPDPGFESLAMDPIVQMRCVYVDIAVQWGNQGREDEERAAEERREVEKVRERDKRGGRERKIGRDRRGDFNSPEETEEAAKRRGPSKRQMRKC